MGQNAQDPGSGMAQGAQAGSSMGPWGAAIGGVAGLFGGISNANKADDAKFAQIQALQADQIKRDQFASQEKNAFDPMRQRLLDEAANPNPLNYGPMAGAINQNYDAAQRNSATQMAQRGMTGSGLQGGQIQGLEMGRAGALAGAFQTGLQARQNLGMNLLQHYNPLGNAQLQVGALPQQVQNGEFQQQLATNQANNAFAAAGKGLGALETMWSKPNPNSAKMQQLQGQMPTSMPQIQNSGMAPDQVQMMGGIGTPSGFTADTTGMIGLGMGDGSFQMPPMGSDLTAGTDFTGGGFFG